MKVRISPKFQIVIPMAIRQRLGLRPGQELLLIEKDGAITAIPDQPLEKLRGIAKGVSLSGLREKQERIG